MDILLTLTTAGSDTGPFDLYENSTGPFDLFESAVPKIDLTTLPGYATVVPPGTTTVRVQSTGLCPNYIDIVLEETTTTSTTSTTTCPTYYELACCLPGDYAYTKITPTLGTGQRYVLPLIPDPKFYTYTGASTTTCSVPLPYQPSIQATLLTGCP